MKIFKLEIIVLEENTTGKETLSYKAKYFVINSESTKRLEYHAHIETITGGQADSELLLKSCTSITLQ